MRASSLSLAITRLAQGSAAWSPLSLWPDGIDSPGMWISPRTLTSEWQEYNGLTPVATPGTVADSSNPVGLALDIRAGAPEVLGPELVVNGDFSDGTTGWVLTVAFTVSDGKLVGDNSAGNRAHQDNVTIAGKWYQVSFDYVSISGAQLRLCNTSEVALVSFAVATGTSGTHSAKFLATGTTIHIEAQLAAFVGTLDNISVKELPGNHMLQSTSAARPLMSARRNLLTYTEDFSNAAWAKADVSITPNSITSPDNGVTASKVTSSGSVTTAYVFQFIQNVALFSHSFYAKAGTSNFVCFTTNTNACYANFNISTGSVASYSGCTAAISAVGDGWYRCSITEPASGVYFMILGKDADPGAQPYGTGVWASGKYIYLWGPQLQYGPSVVTPYQSVPGDGSTYATAFPIAQKYDGVDDGMATATFTAGDLINGMDCMIPVRRDSGTIAVAGLSSRLQNIFFGIYVQGENVDLTHQGCGTPVPWVDGVELTGGTSATRGTLYNALTAGEWHILEYRGLDLSAWTKAEWGDFGGTFFLNGARGDILLFPSTASTEDKDAARQYLADYYGVTLP